MFCREVSIPGHLVHHCDNAQDFSNLDMIWPQCYKLT
jgi:hypothetical protein